MFKLLIALIVLPVLLLVTGCGRRTLSGEALEQARTAIEIGDFNRGSLLLVAGGCDDLHAQSIYLIHMASYHESGNLLGMVRSWKGIYFIETDEMFVREAGYRLLSTTLENAIVADNRQ